MIDQARSHVALLRSRPLEMLNCFAPSKEKMGIALIKNQPLLRPFGTPCCNVIVIRGNEETVNFSIDRATLSD
jgi:hypothetical protein